MKPIEVFTLRYLPFTMGGRVWQPVKTMIEEYEILNLGGRCAIFYNPVKELWHIALVMGGAIVSTAPSKEEAIAELKMLVETADRAIVLEQIEKSIVDCRIAPYINRDHFFSLFKRRDWDE